MAPKVFLLFIFLFVVLFWCQTIKSQFMRKFTSLLFGDSTIDTGNNNYIFTLFKGNHIPYGKNYFNHVPIGRFSNGKLVPDILAISLKLKKYVVPPYLNPSLLENDYRSGVCFASAGSGYDDLTSSISGHEGVSRFSSKQSAKELYELGCCNIIVSGLPPIGCLPIQMTEKSPLHRTCIEKENSDSQSYNKKLEELLPYLQAQLPGSKILYADIYTPLSDFINNPHDYGKFSIM
ncbi:hypothetical protein P3S68_031273 [Capsicum galapagoense]